MRIVVTGARGMLGRTLTKRLHEQGHTLHLAHSERFNIADPDATHQAIQEAKPDIIIHPAAFTAVDRCETEEESAFSVNAQGSAHMAIAAQRVGARLIAISTDYVFSGDKETPYVETDPTNPRTVYGQSKLAGEEAIRAHCPDHVILRVAWLYGAGGPSFVHTMLKLGAMDGPPLKVVNDQYGNPTSCEAVTAHIIQLLSTPTAGTFHLTSEGETTWYDFTKKIFALKNFQRSIEPCSTDEYPRPAPRPKNSRLDNRGLRMISMPPMPHWEESLETFLRDTPTGG